MTAETAQLDCSDNGVKAALVLLWDGGVSAQDLSELLSADGLLLDKDVHDLINGLNGFRATLDRFDTVILLLEAEFNTAMRHLLDNQQRTA